MNWYTGGIEEAVRTSKQKDAIFVVYIEGKDEKSEEVTQMINSKEVSELLGSEYFVAIKILSDSVSLEHFKQIYRQVDVPSVFFIGKHGIPLEIMTGSIGIGDFLKTLNQVLVRHGTKITTKQEAGTTSENLIKPEQEQAIKDHAGPSEGNVHVVKPTEQASTSKENDTETVDEQSLTTEEKVERAKELVIKTREAKQAQEEEEKRKKEIERRKVGQDVQKLKRWQQETDLKDLVEERNKEKREEKAARERVLNQIAQDKAEREARFAAASPKTAESSIPKPSPPPPPTAYNDTARLQFRLPDGRFYTHEFSSTNTLQDVRQYIIENLNLPYQAFSLSTTFPRHEYTAEEYQRTLMELNLTPSAVILILPTQNLVTPSTNSWLISLLWSFISPLLNVLGYLKNRIVGGTSTPSTSSSSVGGIKRSADNVPDSSRVPNKVRLGESSVVRRQGNIHQLADRQDSDDENNTWNGNSTQQM